LGMKKKYDFGSAEFLNSCQYPRTNKLSANDMTSFMESLYPDQYVKLQILASHTEGNTKFVDEFALESCGMKIEYVDGLLQTSLTLNYKGQALTIDKLVIDTGASHT
jgi:hypothetical protein